MSYSATIRQRRFNATSTIRSARRIHAGNMDPKICAQCGKSLNPARRRATFCGRRCRWRAWHERNIVFSRQAQHLPIATLPADAEQILPAVGPERLQVANRLALGSRAPADARGYRLGIQQGSRQLMRWLPPARLLASAMFSLDPFQGPAVPLEGTYAVVYVDSRCQPIGGPRFTLTINQLDRRLLLSDGDRTFKPRLRG